MKHLLIRAFLTLAVAAIGIPFLSPAPAHSASITTLFASNNVGSVGGAVYFDVTIGSNLITITGFETNTREGTGTFGFEVYTTPGMSVGNQDNMLVWTSVATGVGTAAGTDNPSSVALNSSFQLAANTMFGIAIILDGPEGAAVHLYTNGTGANQNYSNGDLSLAFGSASNVPFTEPIFDPRVWNGTIIYEVGNGVDPIPEPSTMLLLGSGLVGLFGYRMRKAQP